MIPRPLARPRRWAFVRLVGIGVGQAFTAVSIAVLVQRGFDLLVGTAGAAPGPLPTGAVVWLVAGLAGAVLGSALFRGAERLASEQVAQHYVQEVRDVLFAHLTRVPSRELGRRHRGSMLLRFAGDLSALRLWVGRGLARLLVAGVAVGLVLTALAVMNPALAVAVGGVLVVGGLLTWAASPRLLRTARASRRRRSRLTGEVTERLTQLGVLQSAGQERRERRRMWRRSQRVADAMVEQAGASGTVRGIAEGAAAAAGVAALLVGAFEVREGRASAGTVLAAVSLAGLLGGYLRDLGRVAEYAAGARIARRAVRTFLEIPPLPDPDGQPALEVQRGSVQIERVSVGQALSDVTLRARGGSRVAVVGANGAGKSTLVALVARLSDPDAGELRIDGQDVRHRSLASVRAAVGIASPDLPLLRGSLRRNVCYRNPRVEEDELARVSALCGLDELAAELPEGWRTDVGEAGGRLSAGQRGRVAVARAALGRPPLLVLDEAESHLDAEASRVVDRVLDQHRGTALVVTHRRELVERADEVWCLQEGAVVETGPPRLLLAGDGPTARLFAADPAPVPALAGRS